MARPRQFDREVGLTKAMRLFWARGYGETSIGDLTEELGISRPSLYAAYGDKEQLFREVLDLFHGTVTVADRAVITLAEDAEELEQKLLASCVDRVSGVQYPPGCLMSGAMSDLGCLSDELVAAVTGWLGAFEGLIADRFRSFGVQDAEIRAARLVVAVSGLSTYARANPGREKLDLIAKSILSSFQTGWSVTLGTDT